MLNFFVLQKLSGRTDARAYSSLNTTHFEATSHRNLTFDEDPICPQAFKVLGLIGKGSFGEVYLVEKKNTKAHYAMKVLHKSMINSKQTNKIHSSTYC